MVVKSLAQHFQMKQCLTDTVGELKKINQFIICNQCSGYGYLSKSCLIDAFRLMAI